MTAGGTREPIDAVRFVGNRSSGRMGFALAEEAARRGADVTVVAANVGAPARPRGIGYVDVQTAEELAEACEAAFDAHRRAADGGRRRRLPPAEAAHAGKLKKDEAGAELDLRLVRTPDVLAALADRRRPGQLLVGFAAEHGARGGRQRARQARAQEARRGRRQRRVPPGIAFDAADNEVMIVTREVEVPCRRQPRREVARAIVDAVLSRRSSSDSQGAALNGAPRAHAEAERTVASEQVEAAAAVAGASRENIRRAV